MNIAGRSVEVILAGQSPVGGYVACPDFEQYRYCWFRDGSFIADAMREAGHVESTDRFFDWCARVILSRPTGPWDARYSVDGAPDPSPWPKLQLDGLGLFLPAVRRRDSSRWNEATTTVARWLEHHWGEPCVDWWEEREGVHAVTLWCVAEGLDSDDLRAEAIRLAADEQTDGSHLHIGTPVLVERVEESLLSGDTGVHRYLDDTYYGGGQWLLLTAMLGLAKPERAEECLHWIEAHARANGDLPEQSQDGLLHPERYEPWVEKWGEPASPLLWSHAMYLRLHHALRDRR